MNYRKLRSGIFHIKRDTTALRFHKHLMLSFSFDLYLVAELEILESKCGVVDHNL